MIASATHAEAAEESPHLLLEQGHLGIYARPRVGITTLRTFSDVQKLGIVLLPADELKPARRIHVGRKRLPSTRVRQRGWAWVDRVGTKAELIDELVASRTYMTKTRGLRHQSGAIEVASGTYAIEAHRDHAHLTFDVTHYADSVTELLLSGLGITPHASYITAVFNPERKTSDRDRAGEDDVPFGEPSIYDDDVIDHFQGRKFAPLSPTLLDTQGAELILISAP